MASTPQRPDNATLKRLVSRRFPATRFRVNGGRGTSYGWTHVSWTDGPSERLVNAYLATIGAAPGYMDETDYYVGNRISVTRKLTDAFRLRIAQSLLGSKAVPPVDVWCHGVQRPNHGGWYDLRDCVWQASCAQSTLDLERARFEANAWLEAWAHNTREMPQSVQYA